LYDAGLVMGNSSVRQYIARGSYLIVLTHAPFPGGASPFYQKPSNNSIIHFSEKMEGDFIETEET
jgi:hypothetical protein